MADHIYQSTSVQAGAPPPGRAALPGLTSTAPLLVLLCPLLSVTVRVKLYLPSTRLPRNNTAW